MAGPPDIAPDELWVHLSSLQRPHRILDYPRVDPVTGQAIGKIAMRVLSQAELMSCAAAAEKYTTDILKKTQRREEYSKAYEDIYANESTVQILFRSVYRAKKVDSTTWELGTLPFFPSPDAIRGNEGSEGLTQDEIGVLLRSYLIVQRELGPIISKMTVEEMEAWVSVLAKGGSTLPLARLTSEARDDLVMLMASRLVSYMTDTSSSGSPPGASLPSGAIPPPPKEGAGDSDT